MVVTDPVDTTAIDLRSLRLGPITIAETLVQPPAGAVSVSTTLDLRPRIPALAHVSAWIDRSVPEAVWVFDTIDPSTGLPSEDPLIGFLPPDVNPPEGQASVSLEGDLKAQAAGGSLVANTAFIKFDANDVIPAVAQSNIVDPDRPQSRVTPLPPLTETTAIPVSWSAIDPTSGVEGVDVFVAEDTSAFRPWLSQTAAVADTFIGQAGHTYRFFSMATDTAGNVELPPDSADAATRIAVTTGVTTASVVVDKASPDSVRIVWLVSESATEPLPQVEVRTPRDDWSPRGQARRVSPGVFDFIDRRVAPGDSIAFRLVNPRGVLVEGSAIWVKVPSWGALSIAPASGNPSRGRLSLRCNFPRIGSARLEIFDVAGRRVREERFQVDRPGRREIDGDQGGSLPAGTYIARLRVGAESKSVRFVLVK